MRQVITDDFGQIKVGDTLLPGILQKIEVEGSVRIDDMEVPGSSGSSKQPQGFEDAIIYIELLLPTDDATTCYDKLQTLVGIFKKVDKYAKPYIYRIVNKHTQVWNIKEVVFKNCRTTEDNITDSIKATLEFKEYKPVLVKVEQISSIFDEVPPNQFTKQEQPNILNILKEQKVVFSPMGFPIFLDKSPITDEE